MLCYGSEAEARERLSELGARATAAGEADDAAREAMAFWMDHVYMFGGRLYEVRRCICCLRATFQCHCGGDFFSGTRVSEEENGWGVGDVEVMLGLQ